MRLTLAYAVSSNHNKCAEKTQKKYLGRYIVGDALGWLTARP